MAHQERRRFPRTDTQISVKCRRSARTVFTPGQTIDCSPSGALIELSTPRPAQPGERLALAFDRNDRPVTRAAHMVTATVVRALEHDDQRSKQTVAVHFDAPQFGLEGLDHHSSAA